MGVVGAEKGGLRAVLIQPRGHFFQNELLRAGHAHVAGGVGSGFEMEVDAEVLAGRFHDVATTRKQFVAHVAGEGNMHKIGDAQLLGGIDDQITARDVVGIDGQVGGRFDDARVLVGLAREEQDVGTGFADTAEPFGGAGNGLVDDNRLHQRVVGERGNLRDGGLHLGHEIVGIGDVLNHAAVGDITVLLDQRFGSAQIVLGLRHRTGADTDVKFGGFGSRSMSGKGHSPQAQHGSDKMFHTFLLQEKSKSPATKYH